MAFWKFCVENPICRSGKSINLSVCFTDRVPQDTNARQKIKRTEDLSFLL